ncbi:unnamed protein product [Vitrella brassicaformis CCMP3155]|uniref:Uncharacterized protein n=3 Tax=Vitrella brassicaformis TaxID=1169539 RepID=A0A0G4F8T8_VITBC|nr:unnamed protein product [Vitrella brassicaformis CCMP3155]|eukprot:CEM08605.1 unnamed protein product [Vitrella brassicaformis CCMP3155]
MALEWRLLSLRVALGLPLAIVLLLSLAAAAASEDAQTTVTVRALQSDVVDAEELKKERSHKKSRGKAKKKREKKKVREDDDKAEDPSSYVELPGERVMLWHKMTFDLTGPEVDEMDDENPFEAYRIDLKLTHKDLDKPLKVPCYFAADGDAAETSATGGDQWRCHFMPIKTGTWKYKLKFTQGDRVAVDKKQEGEPAGFFDGASGAFEVLPSDKKGKDSRRMGLLRHVGERYLKFAGTDEYFIKAGVDGPENLLAYEGFDNTPNYLNLRKTYPKHIEHWKEGDPTWQGGKGKGLIGALNYLDSVGLNAFSFLTFNDQGDDRNVFPYVTAKELGRFDVSKLAQWEKVFEHATKLGLTMHFKTQEAESIKIHGKEKLEDSRRLYYRELQARFGHHANIIWNIGEETTMPVEAIRDSAEYWRSIDPYEHPMVVHTHYPQIWEKYVPLMGENSPLDGPSMHAREPFGVNNLTRALVRMSHEKGKAWAVMNDEQGPWYKGVLQDAHDPDHDVLRQQLVWGNLLAGGAGFEFYFGWGWNIHKMANETQVKHSFDDDSLNVEKKPPPGNLIQTGESGNDDNGDGQLDDLPALESLASLEGDRDNAPVAHSLSGCPEWVICSACSDITCEDFTNRHNMWLQAAKAIEFFKKPIKLPASMASQVGPYDSNGGDESALDYRLPFWAMWDDNNITAAEDDFALVNDDTYLIMTPTREKSALSLALPSGRNYAVAWWNPKEGGPLVSGDHVDMPALSAAGEGAGSTAASSLVELPFPQEMMVTSKEGEMKHPAEFVALVRAVPDG